MGLVNNEGYVDLRWHGARLRSLWNLRDARWDVGVEMRIPSTREGKELDKWKAIRLEPKLGEPS